MGKHYSYVRGSYCINSINNKYLYKLNQTQLNHWSKYWCTVWSSLVVVYIALYDSRTLHHVWRVPTSVFPLQWFYATLFPLLCFYATLLPLQCFYSTLFPLQCFYATLFTLQCFYATLFPLRCFYATLLKLQNTPKPIICAISSTMSQHWTAVISVHFLILDCIFNKVVLKHHWNKCGDLL